MKTFIFHAGTINSDTATEAAAATHNDYLVIPQSKLTKMAATNGGLKLYFDDSKDKESLVIQEDTNNDTAATFSSFSKLVVTLTVANASIPTAAERIATLLGKSKSAFIKFDSVNSVFDVEEVTGVSILNTSAVTAVS
tara:strand:- start:279 stop:692 length:414 start_codon:yes stop_codon:yes gene_type:complete